MSKPAEMQIKLTLTDGMLREALDEWVQKHTVFRVLSYEGVVGGRNTGTFDFPDFVLGVEVRKK